MKTKRVPQFRVVCAAIATLLSIPRFVDAADIPVTSGSFESPDPTAQSGDWANLDLAWENGPATGLEYEQNKGDNITADTGSWSAYLTSGPFSQNLNATVAAGDTLSVSFSGGKASNPHGSSGGGTFTVTFDVGGTDYTSTFDTTTNVNTWETFSLQKTITNSGNLSLEFVSLTGNPWIDTVGNVSQVPEPGSVFLLGLSGLSLLARRQR